MGKVNEGLQWSLIILIILFLVVSLVLVVKYLPPLAENVVVAATIFQRADMALKNVQTCETKNDCTYGVAEVSMEDVLGGLFDEGRSDYQDEYTGCINEESYLKEADEPLNAECICISGRCGYIT